MANFLKDNDDLLYYLERGIDWEELVRATEPNLGVGDAPDSVEEAVELYRDILELVGQFVAEEVAPRAAAIDAAGLTLQGGEVVVPPELEEIFKNINELDLHGLTIPRELGGMNAPMLLYFLVAELMARADVSVTTHYSFHSGIAMSLLFFSMMEGTTELDAEQHVAKTRFADEIAEIVRGDAWGSMDITEPDAGSDMAALRAVGVEDESGQWFVTGQKIFITSGHGKYHFVIARTEKATASDDPAAGLRGLSMFLVPAYEDTDEGRRRLAVVERVEHKLGHNGSVTATLAFERTPAHLIGKRGEGFRYMLMLMNDARLGVGFEAIGLCEAAYRMAQDYAAERPSMGKTIDRHELIADYLDEMRTDIQGLRAVAMYGAEQQELGKRKDLQRRFTGDAVAAKRLEKEAKRHARRTRRITPLLKYLAAEKAVELSRRCLQIHGGNGYIKEYGAEKLLRDAMVLPIYEGTSQIQALMATKDAMGAIIKNPQAFARRLAQARWRSLSARDSLERRVAKIQLMSLSAQQHLITRTATDKMRSLQGVPVGEWPKRFLKKWDARRDFAYALLHAERLTRLLCDEAICRRLLAQAEQHEERRELLERYLERAEPRCRFLQDEIMTTGRRLLASLGVETADEPAENG